MSSVLNHDLSGLHTLVVLQIRYIVEGVASNWSQPFRVQNRDPVPHRYVAFIDMPKHSIVSPKPATAELAIGINQPLAEPWEFQQLDSFGRAIPNLETLATVVDTLGLVIPTYGLLNNSHRYGEPSVLDHANPIDFRDWVMIVFAFNAVVYRPLASSV